MEHATERLAPTIPAPAWATHVIVAQLEASECDLQTDYFGSRTTRTRLLAWSKHGRDLFAEMRKAAALFPETAHLGPGKSRFHARVVFAANVEGNGTFYGEHQFSPWHHEFDHDPTTGRPLVFLTEAEAQAHMAKHGQPHPVHVGAALATFRWRLTEDDVEQREKYSMGHGYYLAHDRYHGWQVRKLHLGGYAECIAQAHAAGDFTPGMF